VDEALHPARTGRLAVRLAAAILLLPLVAGAAIVARWAIRSMAAAAEAGEAAQATPADVARLEAELRALDAEVEAAGVALRAAQERARARINPFKKVADQDDVARRADAERELHARRGAVAARLAAIAAVTSGRRP
jgi:hypothetical protein